jgi:ABC-type amino acid transport system permease subunit
MIEAVPRTRPAPRERDTLSIPLQAAGALLFVILVPIAFGMHWENFQPLLQPSALRFLAIGGLVTLLVALVALGLSLPLATALALGRLTKHALIRWPCIGFVEAIRSLPVLLLILYVNMSIPGLFEGLTTGAGYPSLVLMPILTRAGLAVTLALTIHTAAVNAELLRAGILALDRGQYEAARALGLSYWQAMRRVILPQAFRLTRAPLIAQFTILLKDASLGAIIGFVELQRRAQILYQRDFNPMEALFLIALVYFVLNYLLGLSRRVVERRYPMTQ